MGNNKRHIRRKRSVLSSRRGAAATEAAACLPVLLLIVLGAIQASSMIFVRQAITAAAYEGVRTAVAANATSADAEAACQHVLDERSIVDTTITVDPVDLVNAPRGQYVTVTVTAPSKSNTFLHGWYFGSTTVEGQAVMMKEF